MRRLDGVHLHPDYIPLLEAALNVRAECNANPTKTEEPSSWEVGVGQFDYANIANAMTRDWIDALRSPHDLDARWRVQQGWAGT